MYAVRIEAKKCGADSARMLCASASSCETSKHLNGARRSCNDQDWLEAQPHDRLSVDLLRGTGARELFGANVTDLFIANDSQRLNSAKYCLRKVGKLENDYVFDHHTWWQAELQKVTLELRLKVKEGFMFGRLLRQSAGNNYSYYNAWLL